MTCTSSTARDAGGDEILLAFARARPRRRGRRSPRTAPTSSSRRPRLLGADDQRAYASPARSTLCTGPDDLDRFDQVFEAFFNARARPPASRPASARRPTPHQLPLDDSDGGVSRRPTTCIRAAASATEVLRHRDVASLTAGEKQRLAAMFATLRPRAPLRRTARHQRWHRGQVDASRTLRESLRRMGEPGRDRLASPGDASRVASCCSSTSAAR